MKIQVLGICGTFMGSLALLAKALGHEVSGVDSGCFSPMKEQLEASGIELILGYEAEHLDETADQIIVGNALTRGNPMIEALLNKGLNYTSGPAWLCQNVLKDKWVLAVSGTHGKTTTASMLAWILSYNGYNPGFLIGGVPKNFGFSAQLGDSDFFVIEADEYDTAFFDKRSKFVHYRPRTLIINNIEFDHADIFKDVGAIQQQFRHVVRTMPTEGLILYPEQDLNVQQTLSEDCWTPCQPFWGGSAELTLVGDKNNSRQFGIAFQGKAAGQLDWSLMGEHNQRNAFAAILAARHVGVLPSDAIEALNHFQGVKRRLEVVDLVNGVTVYDDFAHHPTAIAATIDGIKKQVKGGRVIAVIEPRSNTMRLGIHKTELLEALKLADTSFCFQSPSMSWDINDLVQSADLSCTCFNDIDTMVEAISAEVKPGDHIVVMSNGPFGGIHDKLSQTIKQQQVA